MNVWVAEYRKDKKENDKKWLIKIKFFAAIDEVIQLVNDLSLYDS